MCSGKDNLFKVHDLPLSLKTKKPRRERRDFSVGKGLLVQAETIVVSHQSSVDDATDDREDRGEESAHTKRDRAEGGESKPEDVGQ